MAKRYMQDPAGFMAAEAAQQERLRALRAAGAAPGARTLREDARRVPPETAYPAGRHPQGSPENALPCGHFEDIPVRRLGWQELRPFFDWRMFFGICGLKCLGQDGCKASSDLEHEALSIIAAQKPEAIVCARFHDCRRDGDDIVALDGSLRLPMLRDTRSLSDFFPTEGGAQLGLFAVRVDAGAQGDFVGHAVRVTLAEAASEYLGHQWQGSLPEGLRLIRPGIGYACCPDHSLKRDVLAALPDMGITLTDSCAMIPEASICGLIIAHRDAAYHDIRHVDPAALDAYAARRGFSEEEKKLFLSHLARS